MRLKSDAEATATIARMRAIEHGFIAAAKWHYLLWLAVLAGLLADLRPLAGAALAIFLADWIVYVARRRRELRRFEAAPVRLRTGADFEALERLYESAGRRQPTMSDWVELAAGKAAVRARSGTTSGASKPAAACASSAVAADRERYLAIRSEYDRLEPRPAVTVDVGANDGRAWYDFGIGGGSLYIGVDISLDLLRRFAERAAGGRPVLADGTRLPLRSGSVDFLFCTETLEHLSAPEQAVAEFVRVLRPGGRLMIQSPNAHRVRNLNLFHLLTLCASLFTDRILQKKIVHENTWHTGMTYHWDFSIQDYRRMIREAGADELRLSSSGFFFPPSLLRGDVARYRSKERIFGQLPLVRFFGDDLVLLARRSQTAP